MTLSQWIFLWHYSYYIMNSNDNQHINTCLRNTLACEVSFNLHLQKKWLKKVLRKLLALYFLLFLFQRSFTCRKKLQNENPSVNGKRRLLTSCNNNSIHLNSTSLCTHSAEILCCFSHLTLPYQQNIFLISSVGAYTFKNEMNDRCRLLPANRNLIKASNGSFSWVFFSAFRYTSC